MAIDGPGHPRSASDAIAAYIRAKDGNRPHLLQAVFTKDALLEMSVPAGAISFPPRSQGLDELAQVLVSRFNQTYENIYTFCLAAPPDTRLPTFFCDWLVGMSEKGSGAVRAGCGRYQWSFRAPDLVLVEKLAITIELMHTLPPGACPQVMEWLAKLPYPWCPAGAALASIPRMDELGPIAERLSAKG